MLDFNMDGWTYGPLIVIAILYFLWRFLKPGVSAVTETGISGPATRKGKEALLTELKRKRNQSHIGRSGITGGSFEASK